MLTISADVPLAHEITEAVQTGDLESLHRLLNKCPDLGSGRIKTDKGVSKTLLHVATDWPGHFPNGAAIVSTLVDAGADVNARLEGSCHLETPLHWAASSDDVEVAEALIVARADLNVPGGSIGMPLENAVGYGQWQIARFLADRGAKVNKVWVAAALGMTSLVQQFLDGCPKLASDEINEAFWQACHGGQIRTAKLLFDLGVDLNWTPNHNNSTPLEIASHVDGRREALIGWLKQHGAQSNKHS